LRHAVSLGFVLGVMWLLLSGHTEPLLLCFGLISVLIVVAIALRMEVVDHEVHLVGALYRRLLFYWVWLLYEIVKASVDVTRVILDPKLPISPQVFKAKVTQRTNVGRVTYANSITLTPGTVTIDLDDDDIEVHALTREAAEGLMTGDMDRRVTALEGQR
jgi:multicomponent Na+:H+ antiporter subunit E